MHFLYDAAPREKLADLRVAGKPMRTLFIAWEGELDATGQIERVPSGDDAGAGQAALVASLKNAVGDVPGETEVVRADNHSHGNGCRPAVMELSWCVAA